VSIALAVVGAVWTALDELRRPQQMAIMNVVWPVTVLYSGALGLWAYFAFGRQASKHERHDDIERPRPRHSDRRELHSFPKQSQIAKGTLHCGAGCALGDLIAETLIAVFPALAVLLGWHTLWHDAIFSVWILDFLLAFALGILFQYWSIKPMHEDLSPRAALKRALQADTLSLIAWQTGMYAVMALAHFWIAPRVLQARLQPGGVVFWWFMQFAMLAGFCTSYPVNRWLIRRGIKETM
jgi:hypothetical protein